MKKLLFCGICYVVLALNVTTSSAFPTKVVGEPGPDFKTWTPAAFNEDIGWEPPLIKKRVYYNPSNPSFWGFTLSLKAPTGNEIVLLKVWNIRLVGRALEEYANTMSRLRTFFYRDPKSEDDITDVESTLWLGKNLWFFGDKGRLPYYTDKAGEYGNNLIIKVFKFDRDGHERCRKKEPPFDKLSNGGCDEFFDPQNDGIQISIPAYYYSR